MKRIALVTCKKIPALSPDERLVLPHLQARGIEGMPAVWDDPAIDWNAFQAIIIRNTWDYYIKVDAFSDWLDKTEATGVPIYNPPDVIRRNIRKTYLKELQLAGVKTIPTYWIELEDELLDLEDEMTHRGWTDLVIKPAISAGGHHTYKLKCEELHTNTAYMGAFKKILTDTRLMVQPYFPEVATHGELSFIFFNKVFSHAVIKKPAAGKFLSQSDHGGSVTPYSPTPAQIAEVTSILTGNVSMSLLYARLDFVPVNGELLLMEMELTEPSLYLAQNPKAAERFADAISKLFALGT